MGETSSDWHLNRDQFHKPAPEGLFWRVLRGAIGCPTPEPHTANRARAFLDLDADLPIWHAKSKRRSGSWARVSACPSPARHRVKRCRRS